MSTASCAQLAARGQCYRDVRDILKSGGVDDICQALAELRKLAPSATSFPGAHATQWRLWVRASADFPERRTYLTHI